MLRIRAALLIGCFATAPGSLAAQDSARQEGVGQEAPALPTGVSADRAAPGSPTPSRYIAARKSLYYLSRRSAQARIGRQLDYCIAACQRFWTPLSAPADAVPMGDWSVVDGAQGPQWAWQTNPVFTFNADGPRDRKGDQWDDLFVIIPYSPPRPAFTAPAAVDARLVDEQWRLTDRAGHALYTLVDTLPTIADQPLAAGNAARDVGDWQVQRSIEGAQWLYRGQPVYVASDSDLPTLTAQRKRILP